MLMSRLRTDRHTHGNVKVEQYSAEAESAIAILRTITWSKRLTKSGMCGLPPSPPPLPIIRAMPESERLFSMDGFP